MKGTDAAELVERARAGEARAVARLISLVEDESPDLRAVSAALPAYPASAHVIGVTGPPGVGKSSLTGALVAAYRQDGLRVGVLAVDPTSPFSGGALLGDRVRMQGHATDGGVFIRSMATRGRLGGLAAAVPLAVRVLDAAGFDVVLVETVGVGQSEIEVAGLADTTLVLLAPGMGDSIQIAKAGVLEVGDVYVVNKSDKEGAERVSRDLRHMLHLAPPSAWAPPVVRTIATAESAGTQDSRVDELVAAIAAHRAYLDESGALETRRRERTRHEIETLAIAAMRAKVGAVPGDERLDRVVGYVVDGDLDTYAAVDVLLGEQESVSVTPDG
ncbi:MAG TPA: methylmalonyl Co-A mutase-associated GTPase MeaB [Actinopolymorphaceae bacterium]